MHRFAVGFWTQRVRKLSGPLLRAFGDLYAPSFVSVPTAIQRVLLMRALSMFNVGTNAYT